MDRRAEVALVQTAVAAMLWGTSFPVISLGLKNGLDPGIFVFLRFAVAAPLMLVGARLLRRSVVPILRSREVWILAGLNAVGFLCQFVGQQYTRASVAALLVNLSLVLAAVGGAVFLRERLGGLKIAGVVLAILGTALVTTNGDLSGLGASQVFGDALYVVTAMTWAAYIVYAKDRTDRLHWDPVPLAGGIVLLTALMTLPAALWSGVPSVPGGFSLGLIIYTAVLNTALPFVFYQQGLRYLTAGSSAIVLVLEIVVALAVSATFLGEAITPVAAAGAVMILASFALVSGLELGLKRP